MENKKGYTIDVFDLSWSLSSYEDKLKKIFLDPNEAVRLAETIVEAENKKIREIIGDDNESMFSPLVETEVSESYKKLTHYPNIYKQWKCSESWEPACVKIFEFDIVESNEIKELTRGESAEMNYLNNRGGC